jgi:hypothetical protein
MEFFNLVYICIHVVRLATMLMMSVMITVGHGI